MSQSNDTAKMIVNGAYHAGTLSVLTFANAMAMTKILKWKPANLNQLDLEEFAKLAGSLWTSTMLRDWLVTQGWLPENIMADA